SKVLR
ncbi:hypothetical protein AVEN_119029-1, partial [Araneus ventricosus]